MSDQQVRDRVRRTLDAAARDSIPDSLDLRLDVLRILAQRHGASPDRLVHPNGHGQVETDDNDETLNHLRAWIGSRHPHQPRIESWPALRRQPWRREVLKLAAAALIFALVGALLVVTMRGTGEQSGTPRPTPATAPLPVQSVSETIPVPGRPYGLTVAATGVWVPDTNAGVIRRIDPATDDIDMQIDLGATGWQIPAVCGCSSMFAVSTPDGIWETRSSGTSESPVFEIVRLDPATGEIDLTIPLDVLPDKLAVAAGSVWVTSAFHDVVVRIDSRSGARLATIPLDGPLGMIAATESAVWITSLPNDTVTRIDPTTNTIAATISVASPVAVAVVGDAVWVASLDDGALFKIDPATNQVVATVSLIGPDWLTAAGGSLWVHSATSGEVLRIDPASGDIRARYATGTGVATMAAGEDVLWIALANMQQVLRIDLER
ncbi:MAG TPA: hypothetical protein VFV93_03360 [Thermomicrobiales bacterium]|nr:hypothetical protein [Thermomicrobiales bacterium]